MICVSLLTALTAGGAPASAPGAGGGAAVHEGDEEAESTQRFDGKTLLDSPSGNNDNNVEAEQDDSKSCPLCSEKFPSQERLESHAMSVHSVNCEGLQRLQSLINGSHWLNKKDQGMLFFFSFFLAFYIKEKKYVLHSTIQMRNLMADYFIGVKI